MKAVRTAQRKLAEQLFREKDARRKRLAALPIEEKIRILVEMQKLSLPQQNLWVISGSGRSPSV
jgi:hypothetical protein